MKKKKIVFKLLILLTIFSIYYFYKESNAYVINDDRLKASFIDVGQGDSIFIELPNNQTMLIDAGEKDKVNNVIGLIKSKNYKKIDYVIGTHPHSDHIGGLESILNNFDYSSVYLPKVSHNTTTYKNLLLKIKKDNKTINTALKDKYIIDTDELKVKILAPEDISYKDLNNFSVVIKITYKNNSFLFMGDAETFSENNIDDDVSADVLKVGHHGSTSSSSKKFLDRVKPKYAIISCGKDNEYNLPNKDILNRLSNINSQVLRTDKLGTITLISDGLNITVNN